MNKAGQRASFFYKGSLRDGSVFDDSEGTPHEIVLGRHEVMKVLDDALLEMSIGEERTLEIAAADAYGEYDPEAVQRVPTYLIPNGSNIPEGEIIEWSARGRRPVPAKVLSVADQVAVLDFNHPLAGKDIVYWVKLVKVTG
ncbi:MAG: peptidylprolyl isomerase [Coriobacteriia bacterium]